MRLCLTCLINRKFWSSWQTVENSISEGTNNLSYWKQGCVRVSITDSDTAEYPSWAGPHLQAQCLWNCFWNTSWNLKEVSSESTPQKTYLSPIADLDQLPSSKITLNLLLIANSLCGPQSMQFWCDVKRSIAPLKFSFQHKRNSFSFSFCQEKNYLKVDIKIIKHNAFIWQFLLKGFKNNYLKYILKMVLEFYFSSLHFNFIRQWNGHTHFSMRGPIC